MIDNEYLNFPDDPMSYRDWLPTYEKNILPLIIDRYIPRLQIKKIFDGGCGFGASTLSVGRVFPQSEIWACGLGREPFPQVYEELKGRLRFEKVSIVQFLSKIPERFDLIVLAGVPSHGLVTPEHYQLLAEKVNPGGFLLAMKDINLLQSRFMDPHFRIIELIPPTENDTAALGVCCLWQRR